MSRVQPSHLASPITARMRDQYEDLHYQQVLGSGDPMGFARLLDLLANLADADAAGVSAAMGGLASFFAADAAGLFVASQPGGPLDLAHGHNFPSSAPHQLGTGMRTASGGAAEPITRCHVLDARGGIWEQAAQEAGWEQVLVYTLPRCPARLVLAYTGPAPRLAADLVRASLQSLALSVRHRQVLSRARSLQQEKEELERLIATGINYLNEGAMILDSEGRIVNCNLLAGQLLGYEVDEIMGLPADGVLVSRGDLEKLIDQVISGRSSMVERRLTLYQRYGETLPVHLRIAPLRMRDRPAPHGAVVFFSDRRPDQMELVESSLRQKNAQLERMMSILAHEIRNPLGSIKAGLEYLEPALQHDEEACEDLNTIQREIHRLNRLLTDALLVSRPSEPKTSPQCVTELLDDLLAGREKLLAGRGIVVRKNYQPDLPIASIDRAQMEQVFDNLIVNAIHAMPGGGDLTATVSSTPAPTADPYQHYPVVEIRIGDSGSGISPEIQERIFDPFFTTKTGGTGLGLAVARRIVGQHNGTLRVESWLGIGSIFIITLPAEEVMSE